MASEEEVKVFRSWSSPYALRPVWALELKGVPYEAIFEDLTNKSQLLLQYNPVHGKVPVLVHGGRAVSESLVILEYIDETWTQYPLLPDEPIERASARFWAKFGDEKVIGSITGLFRSRKEQEAAALADVFGNLKPLEEILKGKKYFGGEKIGYLDIALGWISNLVPGLEEILGLELIDEEKFPLLFAWMKDFSQLPIIKETLPPHDKLVAKYRLIRETILAGPPPQE